MTPKQRILKIINNEKPDRIAWSPLMGYNFINAQNENIRNLGIINLWKKLKIDIIDRETVSAYQTKSTNVKVKTFVNETLVKIPEEEKTWQAEVPLTMFLLFKYRDPKVKKIEKYFETPIGTLKSSYINVPSSKTVFQNEYFIKTKDDIRILKYMYENLEYVENYHEIKNKEKEISDDGIVAAGAPGSPVIELIEEYMGLENFLMFLFDYPNEMKSLINTILKKDLEAYEIIAKSSVPLIVVWEDTGTGLYSPGIFNEYIAPAISSFTTVSHKYNKKIYVHSCGLLKDIIADLVATGIDGIMDMTPKPIGNIDFFEARQLIGNKIVLTGGIDANILTSPHKDLIEKKVCTLLEQMKPYGNFILGSGDSVPANTPIDNLEFIYELVDKYGRY
jgi:uroporphyrinogen-III decarboxylase